MQLSHENLMGQDIAFEQLARYFQSTIDSRFSRPTGVALYAFLLEVIDQAGLAEDLSIPDFVGYCQTVLRERCPHLTQAEPEAA